MQKFQRYLINLTPKNDRIFIETKLKSLILHKKAASRNQIESRKIGKKLPKSD